jgi:hypothetical protein
MGKSATLIKTQFYENFTVMTSLQTYNIGFTRTSLLSETVLIAQIYCAELNWEGVKQSVAEGNLLQTRTNRTGDIIFGEIYKRLSLLSAEQLELISEDYRQDVRQLVWIAICKQYHFVGDFTLEVLASLQASGRGELSVEDYGYFFNSKAESHPELEAVSDKTRANAQPALFQIMRQCELLTETNQLIPQMISPAVQNCSPESDLAFIPGAMRL